MSKEKAEVTVDRILSSKNGRWPVFIKLFVLVAAAGIISEIIGTKTIPLGSVGKVNITAMVFAMLIAVLVTPDALGKIFSPLKSICSEKEVELSEAALSFMLLILGVKLGTSSGPNILKILQAGASTDSAGVWESGNNAGGSSDCHASWNEARSLWRNGEYLPRAVSGTD